MKTLRPFLSVLLLLLCLSYGHTGNCQVYMFTKDVLQNTKYIRKNQKVHSVDNAWRENGKLIINFTATIDRRQKRHAYHIVFELDSVLNNIYSKSGRRFELDSATGRQYNVLHVITSTHGIYRYGSNKSEGIELICLKEMIRPGHYPAEQVKLQAEKITSLGKEPGYNYFHQSYYPYIGLKGRHLVFLLYPQVPLQINGKVLGYLLLNIENGDRVKKINYLKLPFAAIFDTVMLPFVVMMSGMQK